jgi:light-regulated signal transduction histidine kinase (bacteriophytochrome)
MQLLLNSKEISMTERTEQYVGFAIDGANRMKRLIQDLLTYSRVGTTEEDFAEYKYDWKLFEILCWFISR